MELTSTRRPESAIRRRGAAIGSISNLWAPVQLLGRRAGELARRFASEPPYLVNMVVNALAHRTQRESQLFADAAIVQAIHERRVGFSGLNSISAPGTISRTSAASSRASSVCPPLLYTRW